MKTRKEILESHRDVALSQLLENEINIKHLEKKSLVAKPGEEYSKLQQALNQKKISIENVKGVLDIIDKMIKVEGGDKE